MKTTFAAFTLLLLAVGCASNHPTPTYTETHIIRHGVVVSPPVEPVTLPRTQAEMDQDLASSVRHEFDRYGELSGLSPNIDISTDRGIVTLMGSVPGAREKEMVDAFVRDVPGVVKVNNMLRVAEADRLSPTGRSYSDSPNDYFNLHVQALTDDDRVLADRILSDLRTDAVLAASVPKVDIFVANGAVTLKGIVQTEEQRRTIVETARSANGVEKVRNDLKVQYPPR